MLRSRQLFAWMAALAVLLHTATAAASIFCAMTGTVSVTCACASDEAREGSMLRGVDSCCSEAIDAQQSNLHDLAPPLPLPMAAHPWEQIVLPIPRVLVASQPPVPCCTSPPQQRLASVILIR